MHQDLWTEKTKKRDGTMSSEKAIFETENENVSLVVVFFFWKESTRDSGRIEGSAAEQLLRRMK